MLFHFKALKDILQHFKFVNWRIRGFVFLISRTSYIFRYYSRFFVQVGHETTYASMLKKYYCDLEKQNFAIFGGYDNNFGKRYEKSEVAFLSRGST